MHFVCSPCTDWICKSWNRLHAMTLIVYFESYKTYSRYIYYCKEYNFIYIYTLSFKIIQPNQKHYIILYLSVVELKRFYYSEANDIVDLLCTYIWVRLYFLNGSRVMFVNNNICPFNLFKTLTNRKTFYCIAQTTLSI